MTLCKLINKNSYLLHQSLIDKNNEKRKYQFCMIFGLSINLFFFNISGPKTDSIMYLLRVQTFLTLDIHSLKKLLLQIMYKTHWQDKLFKTDDFTNYHSHCAINPRKEI